jgi:hypothetical protein
MQGRGWRILTVLLGFSGTLLGIDSCSTQRVPCWTEKDIRDHEVRLTREVRLIRLEITRTRSCVFRIARTYVDPQSDSTVHEEYNVGFYVGYSPKPREDPIRPIPPPSPSQNDSASIRH